MLLLEMLVVAELVELLVLEEDGLVVWGLEAIAYAAFGSGVAL